MDYSVAEYIQMCEWAPAKFLIFYGNVFDSLIYYSHLLPLVFAVFLAGFIYLNNRGSLSVKWFVATTVLLASWLLFDLVLWATETPKYIMFFWSLVNMIEPLIYAGILLFLYVFIDGKGLSIKHKLLVFALLLPVIILAPTSYNVASFNLTNCEREVTEGLLPFYSYIIEIVFALWILVLGMERFVRFKERNDKMKVALITIGAVLFLLSFSMGNVIGSLSENWQVSQYGLFGIPVFLAMLSYIIVRYQAFNVKVMATQFLVAILAVLTFSILFVRDLATVQVIVIITLGFFVVLGNLLVASVRREVQLREDLQIANTGQADLLHIINHQIKGYMTKARYIFDDLMNDKTYNMSDQALPIIKTGFDSVTEGVNFVQDFLNASNIERGTFTYTMGAVDLKEVVQSVAETQQQNAKDKGLAFELSISDGDYHMTGDKAQLNQAVRNLIDNSIKYTLTGGLKVSLERKDNSFLFSVKDTGVGLSDEVKPKLFTKGGRDKDSIKINVNSTGFGLAFVKGVAIAHKGKVWAESPGVGRGSSFYMELPAS